MTKTPFLPLFWDHGDPSLSFGNGSCIRFYKTTTSFSSSFRELETLSISFDGTRVLGYVYGTSPDDVDLFSALWEWVFIDVYVFWSDRLPSLWLCRVGFKLPDVFWFRPGCVVSFEERRWFSYGDLLFVCVRWLSLPCSLGVHIFPPVSVDFRFLYFFVFLGWRGRGSCLIVLGWRPPYISNTIWLLFLYLKFF